MKKIILILIAIIGMTACSTLSYEVDFQRGNTAGDIQWNNPPDEPNLNVSPYNHSNYSIWIYYNKEFNP
jgi:hypothetical protein